LKFEAILSAERTVIPKPVKHNAIYPQWGSLCSFLKPLGRLGLRDRLRPMSITVNT